MINKLESSEVQMAAALKVEKLNDYKKTNNPNHHKKHQMQKQATMLIHTSLQSL